MRPPTVIFFKIVLAIQDLRVVFNGKPLDKFMKMKNETMFLMIIILCFFNNMYSNNRHKLWKGRYKFIICKCCDFIPRQLNLKEP
jgi:hypothetical protein